MFSEIKLCSGKIINFLVLTVTKWGPGPKQVCLGLASSVWVLDSVQERFHCSRGDFERTFIKVGNSDVRKDLGQKKQQK